MAALQCPRCDLKFPARDGWAKAAVSVLMAAPAVPDMATQVRCPRCGYLFAEGEVRYLAATSSRPLMTALAVVALLAAAWIGYQTIV